MYEVENQGSVNLRTMSKMLENESGKERCDKINGPNYVFDTLGQHFWIGRKT